MFGPFGSLREISRPAGTGQRRPGHSSAGRPATHQVGQSNSGRLEPEFAAAAILRLPLPFGGPEARWETGRPRGGEAASQRPVRLRARTHAPTHARTHAQGAVVAVETGFPFRGVFQGLRGLTFSGGQSFSRPAVVWGKWARFPYAFFLQRRSQALKSCDATLALGSHRQPFDSQDGDKLEGIGLRDWKNTSLLCLL